MWEKYAFLKVKRKNLNLIKRATKIKSVELVVFGEKHIK